MKYSKCACVRCSIYLSVLFSRTTFTHTHIQNTYSRINRPASNIYAGNIDLLLLLSSVCWVDDLQLLPPPPECVSLDRSIIERAFHWNRAISNSANHLHLALCLIPLYFTLYDTQQSEEAHYEQYGRTCARADKMIIYRASITASAASMMWRYIKKSVWERETWRKKLNRKYTESIHLMSANKRQHTTERKRERKHVYHNAC